MNLNLNAPTQIVWIVSLVLGLIGLVGSFIGLGAGIGIWFILAGLVVILVATAMKGV